MDTPETYRCVKQKDQACNWVETEGIQHDFGLRARKFVTRLLSSAKVILYKVLKFDKYKRRIVRVYVDGKDLSQQLIRSGLAILKYLSLDPKDTKFYTPDRNFYDSLVLAEGLAKKEGLGF